jgi:GTPase SAR1 family protein
LKNKTAGCPPVRLTSGELALGPENNNFRVEPTRRHDVFKGLSQEAAFEDLIHEMALQPFLDPISRGPRHNSFLSSLFSDLESSLRVLPFEGRHFVVNARTIRGKAEHLPWKGNQKMRKKFLADASNFMSLSLNKMWKVIEYLLSAYSYESVFGYEKYGKKFYYFRNLVRTKHIFGLSDAVDQAMANFNITVNFPIVKTVPWKNCQGRFRSRSRMYCRIRRGQGVQVDFRFQRKSSSSLRRRFDLFLHYLKVFPLDSLEKDYVKMIKLSLAGLFSLKMDQELPEGFEEKAIPVFPDYTQKKLDNILQDKKKRVQFYFNLLQSKGLCAPVGDDMIEEAYVKHANSLCRPPEECIPKDNELFQKLFDYGVNVGKQIHYDPFTTSLPNEMSSIEKNRSQGGNKSGLVDNGTLQKFVGHPLLRNDSPRCEPTVIGLFGPPGSGKTTMVNHLINQLRRHLCPRWKREDFVYSRSCATKHWDGYTNQPVVVLDDFGQDLQDRSDLSEFMMLISLNDYVLPMADLPSKGRKFDSRIVIVTSNMAFGSPLIVDSTMKSTIEDPMALWRRFDLPLLLGNDQDRCQRYQFVPSKLREQAIRQKHYILQDHWNSSIRFPGRGELAGCSSTRKDHLVLQESFPRHRVVKDLLEVAERKLDYHSQNFQENWVQNIHSVDVVHSKFEEGFIWNSSFREYPSPSFSGTNTRNLVMSFPSCPPSQQPVVKAHAIPEPLKVRMITLGECDTKVLQPFQKALWSYLGTQQQFCLTNGVKTLEDFADETLPWIHRIEKVIQRIRDLNWEGNWLSGDYTAATDNFPMWVTEALTEGILSQISHQPTRDWVRWEISAHRISYPHGQFEQTSGQLMGSLLSFPLLCFLNDFVMQESGFHPSSYLVNGDDVVAKGPDEKISNWRELAPRVGLSLSVGKNFVDPDFCTVNSQLFYRGDVLHTGKVSLQTREGTTIGYCFQEAQFYWGPTDAVKQNFLRRNWRALKKTPRSLHLSTDHGGLGLVDSVEGVAFDQGLAKRVYFLDALSPFAKVTKVENAPWSFVCFPLLRGEGSKKEMEVHPSVQFFNSVQKMDTSSPPVEEFPTDLSHRELNEFSGTPRLDQGKLPRILGQKYRDVIHSGSFKLTDAPGRRFLEREYLQVDNRMAKRLSEIAVTRAFQLIREAWIDNSQVHPLEYLGFEESPLPFDWLETEVAVSQIWEDHVDQAFPDGGYSSMELDENENRYRELAQYWGPVQRILENPKDSQYMPRLRGWEKIDQFLSHLDEIGVPTFGDSDSELCFTDSESEPSIGDLYQVD